MLGGKEVALRQKFRGSVLICFVPFCRNSMFTILGIVCGTRLKGFYCLALTPERYCLTAYSDTLFLTCTQSNLVSPLFPGSFFLSRRKPRPETASGLNASNLPQDPSRDIQQAQDGCQETKDGCRDHGYRREQSGIGSRAQI